MSRRSFGQTKDVLVCIQLDLGTLTKMLTFNYFKPRRFQFDQGSNRRTVNSYSLVGLYIACTFNPSTFKCMLHTLKTNHEKSCVGMQIGIQFSEGPDWKGNRNRGFGTETKQVPTRGPGSDL